MEKLLTPEEVAERLYISARTIGEWLRHGKIKGIKVGRLWRIKECDLEHFVQEIDEPLSKEEEILAEAGWQEYLKGEARLWDEAKKGLLSE